MITIRFLGRLTALLIATTAALMVEHWLFPARTAPLVMLLTLGIAVLLARLAVSIWRDDRADYRMFRNFRMPGDAHRVRWGTRSSKDGGS